MSTDEYLIQISTDQLRAKFCQLLQLKNAQKIILGGNKSFFAQIHKSEEQRANQYLINTDQY